MSKDYTASLDLRRVAEQINVILTEIYGKYVAQGSPTKLGGLRFLDVESAKTFAFEKTEVDKDGNLLVLSAPFQGRNERETRTKEDREKAEAEARQQVEEKLKEGPHAGDLRKLVVRTSSDAGKKNKYFVEAAYHLNTPEWLTHDAILKVCQEFNCNGNDAVVRILKVHVLPRAGAIMDHFIAIVRADSVAPRVVTSFAPL